MGLERKTIINVYENKNVFQLEENTIYFSAAWHLTIIINIINFVHEPNRWYVVSVGLHIEVADSQQKNLSNFCYNCITCIFWNIRKLDKPMFDETGKIDSKPHLFNVLEIII